MKYLKRLHDLRVDNDLRQEDIARLLGTTKQTYGRYENGTRKLQIEDLIKLAEFYKVSTDYILGLTKDPAPHWQQSRTVKNSFNNSGNIGNIGSITMK